VAAYRELVTQYHVPIVFGEIHSSAQLAENELANQLGVPTISLGASAPQVVGLHYPIAFSVTTGGAVQAGLFVKFVQDHGYHKVAFVVENTDYGTNVVNSFQEVAKEQNVPVTVDAEFFHVPAVDLTPELLKVQAFQPDLIINAGSGQDCDAIIDQTAAIGLGASVVPQLVAYDEPTESGWWQKHANDGSGLYWTANWAPTQELSPPGEWIKGQVQQQGEVPTYTEMMSFGVVLIIADALNQANSTDPSQLIQTLETGSFDSWLPTPAAFPQADGEGWHHWQAPMLVMQITSQNEPWDQDTITTKYDPPPVQPLSQ
jgi:branched-chain amino acid transport system substrate-binding protein